jgi:putative transposase
MPRHARLDAAGALHHIIIREMERKPIFADDRDRADFVGRCGLLFPETSTTCYAWSILSNHVHLLLRTGMVPLSTVMARLLTGYAACFNRRHQRSGHLFQNRYKSIICQEEAYLKELVRYIHLNPLRVGLVQDVDELSRFPWSGHAVLLGKKKCPWQDAAYVLSFFGGTASYLEFVRAGGREPRPDLTGGGLLRSLGGWKEVKQGSLAKGDDRILGDTSFVTAILSLAEERLEHRYAMRQSGIDLAFLEKRVMDLLAMKPGDLSLPGRQRRLVEARSLFCFRAVRELGISLSALAARFSLSAVAIGYAVERGRRIVRERGYALADVPGPDLRGFETPRYVPSSSRRAE